MSLRKDYGRILEINLSKEDVDEWELDKDMIIRFIGGKGIGAYLLYRILKKGTDPLSPNNLLMFLNGPLTGTPFPSSGRISIITKSPLTGIFLDSYAGGYLGSELRKLGYSGILIKGKAKDHIYLWLSEKGVEFREASFLWGLEVRDVVKRIREKTHKTAHVASIGPAGENKVKFASIMIDSDQDPWRGGAAGRGGAGAVMGSKNLKALAIKALKEGSKFLNNPSYGSHILRWIRKIRNNNLIHIRHILGTSYLVVPMNRLGIIPVRNFTRGYVDNVYGLSGANLKYYSKRDVSCYNCPVACGKIMNSEGKDVKVEYEHIALLGSNNDIKDVQNVAKAVDLCNNLGLDAISTGNVIGFAMECRERELLKQAPEFGDPVGQRKLIRDIVYRRELGQILSEGVRKAAEKINCNKYAIHVKGLELPGYDPRASWGMALAYATSDRGGCHQRAFTVRAEIDGILKRFSAKNVAKYVKEVQDERAIAYSLIVCDFMPFKIDDFIEALSIIVGLTLTKEKYMKIGERIWNLTRLFNIREARVSKKDDTLPWRFFNEPLNLSPDGKKAYLPKEKFEMMLSEYYSLRGWNENGIPTKEKLEELDLII